MQHADAVLTVDVLVAATASDNDEFGWLLVACSSSSLPLCY